MKHRDGSSELKIRIRVVQKFVLINFCNRLNQLKFMATEAQIVKSQKKPKYSTRITRRCWRCGRKRGYMRKFNLCRICFRELANKGEIPGVIKSSW